MRSYPEPVPDRVLRTSMVAIVIVAPVRTRPHEPVEVLDVVALLESDLVRDPARASTSSARCWSMVCMPYFAPACIAE